MFMRPDHLASVMRSERAEQMQTQMQPQVPGARRWRWIAGHRFVDDQYCR